MPKVYHGKCGAKYYRRKTETGKFYRHYLTDDELSQVRKRPRKLPKQHIRKSEKQRTQGPIDAESQSTQVQGEFINRISRLIRGNMKGLILTYKWDTMHDSSDVRAQPTSRDDVVKWYSTMTRHHPRITFRELKKYVFDIVAQKYLVFGLVRDRITNKLHQGVDVLAIHKQFPEMTIAQITTIKRRLKL